jgi:hypothetical protein
MTINVSQLSRCLAHFENPACTHVLKEWSQQSCSLRSYYSTMD